MTVPTANSSASQIPEQLLSTDEYLLLTTALAAAERPFPAAVSCFLSTSPKALPTVPNTVYPPLILTVVPRPKFPPHLLKQLLPLALIPSYSTPQLHPHPPYDPLSFHPSVLTLLRQECAEHGMPLLFPDSLARTASQLANRVSHVPTDFTISNVLSDSLWPHLLPFQQDAVVHAIRYNRGRVLFADDMGMGKTLQALAVADYYRKINFTQSMPIAPTLIICPATLRLTWARALNRWLPSVNRLSVHIVTSASQLDTLLTSRTHKPRDPWDSFPPVSFIVCSYDLLPRLSCGYVFSIVLADECHLLRNFSTARTKSSLPLLLSADVCILISGTPAFSRPIDLYPLLYALLNTKQAPFLSFDSFMDRYCNGGMTTPGPFSRVHELNAILSSVMIRRTKSDVMMRLPPKRRVHVMLHLSAERLKPIRDMQGQAKLILNELNGPHDPKKTSDLQLHREAIYSAMYVRTADAKIKATVTRMSQLLCSEECEVGPKMLIFAHHAHLLDAAEGFLTSRNIRYVRIDGSTSCKERDSAVEAFQCDTGIRAAILSLNVASMGVTLTAADVVLFAELCWVPATLAQAEDRAHRIGRVGTVTVEYLIAPGTVDDAMMTALRGKANLLLETVEGGKKPGHNVADVMGYCSEEIVLSDFDIDTVVSDCMDRKDEK